MSNGIQCCRQYEHGKQSRAIALDCGDLSTIESPRCELAVRKATLPDPHVLRHSPYGQSLCVG
jgi:hypothetical protein